MMNIADIEEVIEKALTLQEMYETRGNTDTHIVVSVNLAKCLTVEKRKNGRSQCVYFLFGNSAKDKSILIAWLEREINKLEYDC